MMVIFIASTHILQNLQRLFIRGWLHLNLLETALKGTVLLDGVTVFVEGSGTDALYSTSCQRRFQDVGGIHRTSSRTGSNHRVYLVDEDDDFRILFQLLDKHLHALLKLSAILRTSYDSRHIERHQPFVEEHR